MFTNLIVENYRKKKEEHSRRKKVLNSFSIKDSFKIFCIGFEGFFKQNLSLLSALFIWLIFTNIIFFGLYFALKHISFSLPSWLPQYIPPVFVGLFIYFLQQYFLIFSIAKQQSFTPNFFKQSLKNLPLFLFSCLFYTFIATVSIYFIIENVNSFIANISIMKANALEIVSFDKIDILPNSLKIVVALILSIITISAIFAFNTFIFIEIIRANQEYNPEFENRNGKMKNLFLSLYHAFELLKIGYATFTLFLLSTIFTIFIFFIFIIQALNGISQEVKSPEEIISLLQGGKYFAFAIIVLINLYFLRARLKSTMALSLLLEKAKQENDIKAFSLIKFKDKDKTMKNAANE